MNPKLCVIWGLAYAVLGVGGTVWTLFADHLPTIVPITAGTCLVLAWSAFRAAVREAKAEAVNLSSCSAVQRGGWVHVADFQHGVVLAKTDTVTPELLEELRQSWAQKWRDSTKPPEQL